MFVCPTKLIPKSDTAHSGIKAGLSLFYGAISYFQAAAAAIIIRTLIDQLSHQIVYTGCPKTEKKILTKIECGGAKLSQGHDLGALDPA